MRHAASRLVASAALLLLLAGTAPVDGIPTWIQSSRRRATRTEVDEHPELGAAPVQPANGPSHERTELAPFVELAPIRLAPPAAIAIERELPRSDPFVRVDRARPSARAPPRAG